MIFVQHRPSPVLMRCVRLLWYCKAPGLPHARERILPRGEMQIIVNLAGDTLTEQTAEPDETVRELPPALLVGARGRYELVDTQELAELVGVVFWPGGAAPFLREDTSAFFEKFTALEDVVSRRDLRARLQEQTSPERKLIALENWLAAGLAGRLPERNPLIVEALTLLKRHSVHDAARMLSISERRLHQLFIADVGLSPKLWSRVQRFQHAVDLLHYGKEPRWEQLALKCRFYDQSHFCNEFRAFSGIDPGTYSRSHRQWANHVPE